MANKKEIKLLIELMERERKKKRTKEESMQILMRAGILDAGLVTITTHSIKENTVLA